MCLFRIIRKHFWSDLTILFWIVKSQFKDELDFYSATSIFAVWDLRFEKSGSRNMVQEIWLEKSGWPEKKIRVCRTTLLEPLFYTFLEKWSQNKWSNAFSFSWVTNFSFKHFPIVTINNYNGLCGGQSVCYFFYYWSKVSRIKKYLTWLHKVFMILTYAPYWKIGDPLSNHQFSIQIMISA